MQKCAVESLFRISPKIDFQPECFTTRKINGKDGWYITGINPSLAYGVADNKGIRKKFWNIVEEKCSNYYGERGGCRRKYRYEHGCYIYTWGNTPIYIGLAKGKKGFYQECFAKHKRDRLIKFFRYRNQSTKTKQNYLHLYLIFWNGQQNAYLEKKVYAMESYLISTAIQAGYYDDLLNVDKTNFKWGIAGFYGAPECLASVDGRNKKQSNCVNKLIKILKKDSNAPHKTKI